MERLGRIPIGSLPGPPTAASAGPAGSRPQPPRFCPTPPAATLPPPHWTPPWPEQWPSRRARHGRCRPRPGRDEEGDAPKGGVAAGQTEGHDLADQLDVFVLRRMCGMPARDVADLLGVPPALCAPMNATPNTSCKASFTHRPKHTEKDLVTRRIDDIMSKAMLVPTVPITPHHPARAHYPWQPAGKAERRGGRRRRGLPGWHRPGHEPRRTLGWTTCERWPAPHRQLPDPAHLQDADFLQPYGDRPRIVSGRSGAPTVPRGGTVVSGRNRPASGGGDPPPDVSRP